MKGKISMDVPTCLGVLLLCGLVFGISMIHIHFTDKGKAMTRESCERFAQEAGLTQEPGENYHIDFKFTGKYKGFNYVLYKATISRTVYTFIEITLPKCLDCHLYIRKEGLIGKIPKALGIQDIEIGDTGFDKTFIIQSQTPQKISKLLTPEVRQKMLASQELIDISLSGQKVLFQTFQCIKGTWILEDMSDIMAMVAKNACEAEGITDFSTISDT